MKKLLLMLIALVIVTTSCKKEEKLIIKQEPKVETKLKFVNHYPQTGKPIPPQLQN